MLMVGLVLQGLHHTSICLSLKCSSQALLAVQITTGYAMDWNKRPYPVEGQTTPHSGQRRGTMPVVKQFVGDFVTNSGLSVRSCLLCSDIAVSCQRFS